MPLNPSVPKNLTDPPACSSTASYPHARLQDADFTLESDRGATAFVSEYSVVLRERKRVRTVAEQPATSCPAPGHAILWPATLDRPRRPALTHPTCPRLTRIPNVASSSAVSVYVLIPPPPQAAERVLALAGFS